MKTETRTRYEPLALPEGWLFLRNEIDNEGHWSLITNAPLGVQNPLHEHELKWVMRIPYTEMRQVSEWTRVPTGELGT